MDQNNGQNITDQVAARIRANEMNAMRTLHGDTTIGKIALGVDALQRERGVSHTDAYHLLQQSQPELFR